MTYVVEPLFSEWARFSDTRLSQTMLGHLGLNKASWGSLQLGQQQTSGPEEPAQPGGSGAAGTPGLACSDPGVTTASGGPGPKDIPQGNRGS